uniref:Uncharacterized protein n=1 Tax=Cannabis sativa TaxID=3483 RepID=A0A803QFA2_CANSA
MTYDRDTTQFIYEKLNVPKSKDLDKARGGKVMATMLLNAAIESEDPRDRAFELRPLIFSSITQHQVELCLVKISYECGSILASSPRGPSGGPISKDQVAFLVGECEWHANVAALYDINFQLNGDVPDIGYAIGVEGYNPEHPNMHALKDALEVTTTQIEVLLQN